MVVWVEGFLSDAFPFFKDVFRLFGRTGGGSVTSLRGQGGLVWVERQQDDGAADGQRLFGVTVGETGNSHESIIELIHRLSHPHCLEKKKKGASSGVMKFGAK